MDTSNHDMSALFQQLGLDHTDAAIDAFVQSHQLTADDKLTDAPYWSEGQAQFLTECYRQDSDWIPVVDDLNTQLHAQVTR